MKSLKINKAFFIVAIALLITTFYSYSQENLINDINWLEKLKVPNVQDIEVVKMNDDVLIYQSCNVMDENLYPGFIGMNKPHLYLVNRKTDERIDKEIILKNGDKRRAFERLLYIDNSMHVISSFINLEQKKYYIFDETINPENLELNNDARKICEIDFGNIKDVFINTVETTVDIKKSIIFLHSSFKTKTGYQYFYDIYDFQWKNKAKYSINTTGNNSFISNSTIDNNDNLYVIETTINKKKVPNSYILYFYTKDNLAPKKEAITVENITSHIQMNVNSKNELLCGGLFAKAQQNSTIGVFSIVYPALLEGNGKTNRLTFTNEFLTKGLDEKEAAKLSNKLSKNKEFDEKYSYFIDTINIQSNGGFSFITEKLKIERIPQKSGFDAYIYTYGDLYIFSCNEDGSFNWQDKISKDQALANSDRFMGHYLPYYDNKNNINLIYCSLKPIRLFGQLVGMEKDVKTVMTTFDSKGNKSEQVLCTDQKLVKQFTPFYSKSCGNGKFIFTRIEPFSFVASYAIGELTLK